MRMANVSAMMYHPLDTYEFPLTVIIIIIQLA
jgi:hypothetical protein